MALLDGRYQLEEKLGGGAMAEVWRALDTELERPVALKILGPSADAERFAREARAVAALSHPNICQLYDFGTVEGRPYMVLEYLPTGTLEDRLRPGRPLADDETRRIAAGISAGLAHAHAHGIVHRDLKPANVLFDLEERPKIADFGIAGVADASTLTEEGTVLGTAAYISPEQVQARRATPASDVYSFGVILYRMLTGRLPFEAERPLDLAELHVRAAPPAVEAARPDAPQDLAALVSTALAKRPADRPADGAALLAAIEGPVSVSATAVTAALTDAPTQVIRTLRRSRRAQVVAAVVALLVLAAAGVAVAVLATHGGSAPASPTRPRAHTGTRATTASPSTSATTRATSTTATSTTAPTTTARGTTSTRATTTPTRTTPSTTAPTTTAPPATTAPPTTAPPTTATTTTGPTTT